MESKPRRIIHRIALMLAVVLIGGAVLYAYRGLTEGSDSGRPSFCCIMASTAR